MRHPGYGEKLFTQTGGPGSLDVRTGGTPDARRVVRRNARLSWRRFALDRDGFRFVRHDTTVVDFFNEDEIRRVYYTEWSGPKRVRDLLSNEADDLLSRRFAIVQVWRPIRHPISPLAI